VVQDKKGVDLGGSAYQLIRGKFSSKVSRGVVVWFSLSRRSLPELEREWSMKWERLPVRWVRLQRCGGKGKAWRGKGRVDKDIGVCAGIGQAGQGVLPRATSGLIEAGVDGERETDCT
jgi:hypothetical protein